MTNAPTPTSSSTGNHTNPDDNPPHHQNNQQPLQRKEEEEKKKLINLLRGWPAPSLLPVVGLQAAATHVLSDPELAVPVLQYGIDPGFQPLREELARWLGEVYHYPAAWRGPLDVYGAARDDESGGAGGEGGGGGSGEKENESASGGGESKGGNMTADEITITGGASQALATVLQGFTDPGYTRAVWVVAPCYFMACPIFEDSGFRGRLRAVPEDEAGVDIGVLERRLKECEDEPWEVRFFLTFLLCYSFLSLPSCPVP
jgi:DNA-binding transcriptional MocR family regulator